MPRGDPTCPRGAQNDPAGDAAYRDALALVGTEPERAHLLRRLASVDEE
ncbi:hypothetical protein [Micromonospora sp. NPDC005254]